MLAGLGRQLAWLALTVLSSPFSASSPLAPAAAGARGGREPSQPRPRYSSHTSEAERDDVLRIHT
jgi:hypothetical protein